MKSKLTTWLRKLLKKEVPAPAQEVDTSPLQVQEEKVEPITIVYPDGAILELYEDEEGYIRTLGGVKVADSLCEVDMSHWTPPMIELLTLYLVDHKNFTMQAYEPTSNYFYSGASVYVHKQLDYTITVVRGVSRPWVAESNIRGIDKYLLTRIVEMLELYKLTDKYQRGMVIRRKREEKRKLRQGKEEAARINKYLGDLNK